MVTRAETVSGNSRSGLSSRYVSCQLTTVGRRPSTDIVAKGPNKSIGAMVLALLMLIFIFRPAMVGSSVMAQWRYESASLVACGLVWCVAGTTTIVAAFWLLGSRGRSRKALRTGGSAIVISGATFAVAAATHVLLCSGPS